MGPQAEGGHRPALDPLRESGHVSLAQITSSRRATLPPWDTLPCPCLAHEGNRPCCCGHHLLRPSLLAQAPTPLALRRRGGGGVTREKATRATGKRHSRPRKGPFRLDLQLNYRKVLLKESRLESCAKTPGCLSLSSFENVPSKMAYMACEWIPLNPPAIINALCMSAYQFISATCFSFKKSIHDHQNKKAP